MISFIVKIFINFSKNYTAGSIHPNFILPLVRQALGQIKNYFHRVVGNFG